MFTIYKITNLINNKIYIGQTNNFNKRWRQHKSVAKKDNPPQIINIAMKKYGIHNFICEPIVCCLNLNDSNYLEELCIKQYDSLIKNNKGYNISLGGCVAPKSEEWKKALIKWRSSLTQERKDEMNKKRSNATIDQIKNQGHPSLGKKRTEEQRVKMSIIQQNSNTNYTPEIRKRMSDAHIGLKDSEETKIKKSLAIKKSWEKRHEDLIKSGELKCHAYGCDVEGKYIHYYKTNNIRYCSKHQNAKK